MLKLLLAILLFASPVLGATYYVDSADASPGVNCTQYQVDTTPALTIAAGINCMSGGDTLSIKTATYNLTASLPALPSGSVGAPTIMTTFNTGVVTISVASSCEDLGFILFNLRDKQYVSLIGTSVTRSSLGVATATNLIFDGNNLCSTMYSDFGGSETTANLLFDGVTFLDSRLSAHFLQGTGHIIRNSRYVNCANSGEAIGGTWFAHCLYPNAAGMIVEDSSFINSVCYGIRNEDANNIIVRRNYSQGNGCAFISVTSGHNAQIYNNISVADGDGHVGTGLEGAHGQYHGNEKGGIYLGPSTGNGTGVYNNTIVNVPASGAHENGPEIPETYGILIGATATNTLVKNNIVWNSNNGNQFINQGTGSACSNNNGNDCDNASAVNPLFTNLGTLDLTIQSGSPSREAGATIAGVITDFLGTARPQETNYDEGAYEYIDPPEEDPGDITIDFPGGSIIQRPATVSIPFTTTLSSGDLTLQFRCASGGWRTAATFAYNAATPYQWTVNAPTCTTITLRIIQGATISNTSGEVIVRGQYGRGAQ